VAGWRRRLLDNLGLGAAGLVCVRDGGAFVTSVPAAVPDGARGTAPEAVQVQPDVDATAEQAQRAAAGEVTIRVADDAAVGAVPATHTPAGARRAARQDRARALRPESRNDAPAPAPPARLRAMRCVDKVAHQRLIRPARAHAQAPRAEHHSRVHLPAGLDRYGVARREAASRILCSWTPPLYRMAVPCLQAVEVNEPLPGERTRWHQLRRSPNVYLGLFVPTEMVGDLGDAAQLPRVVGSELRDPARIGHCKGLARSRRLPAPAGGSSSRSPGTPAAPLERSRARRASLFGRGRRRA
jgi:hypothetical protein